MVAALAGLARKNCWDILKPEARKWVKGLFKHTVGELREEQLGDTLEGIGLDTERRADVCKKRGQKNLQSSK